MITDKDHELTRLGLLAKKYNLDKLIPYFELWAVETNPYDANRLRERTRQCFDDECLPKRIDPFQQRTPELDPW